MDSVIFFLICMNKLIFLVWLNVIWNHCLILLLSGITSMCEILIEMGGRFIRFHLIVIGNELDIKFFFFLLKLFNSCVNFNYLIIEFFMSFVVLLLGWYYLLFFGVQATFWSVSAYLCLILFEPTFLFLFVVGFSSLGLGLLWIFDVDVFVLESVFGDVYLFGLWS